MASAVVNNHQIDEFALYQYTSPAYYLVRNFSNALESSLLRQLWDYKNLNKIDTKPIEEYFKTNDLETIFKTSANNYLGLGNFQVSSFPDLTHTFTRSIVLMYDALNEKNRIMKQSDKEIEMLAYFIFDLLEGYHNNFNKNLPDQIPNIISNQVFIACEKIGEMASVFGNFEKIKEVVENTIGTNLYNPLMKTMKNQYLMWLDPVFVGL